MRVDNESVPNELREHFGEKKNISWFTTKIGDNDISYTVIVAYGDTVFSIASYAKVAGKWELIPSCVSIREMAEAILKTS